MQHSVLMTPSRAPPDPSSLATLPDEGMAAPSRDHPPAKSPADDLARGESVAASMRIMIVEDDFLISMQAEDALVQAGFEVIVAGSAEAALDLAAEHKPVLAVMDIRLPGALDGIDAALELFQIHGLRSIFATAHSDPEVHARAAPAEPAGWLVKPYTMASLVAAVRIALADGNAVRS